MEAFMKSKIKMLVQENSIAVQLKYFEARVLMDFLFWM